MKRCECPSLGDHGCLEPSGDYAFQLGRSGRGEKRKLNKSALKSGCQLLTTGSLTCNVDEIQILSRDGAIIVGFGKNPAPVKSIINNFTYCRDIGVDIHPVAGS